MTAIYPLLGFPGKCTSGKCHYVKLSMEVSLVYPKQCLPLHIQSQLENYILQGTARQREEQSGTCREILLNDGICRDHRQERSQKIQFSRASGLADLWLTLSNVTI